MIWKIHITAHISKSVLSTHWCLLGVVWLVLGRKKTINCKGTGWSYIQQHSKTITHCITDEIWVVPCSMRTVFYTSVKICCEISNSFTSSSYVCCDECVLWLLRLCFSGPLNLLFGCWPWFSNISTSIFTTTKDKYPLETLLMYGWWYTVHSDIVSVNGSIKSKVFIYIFKQPKMFCLAQASILQ